MAYGEANEVETWTARIKPIDGVSSHRETGVVGGLTYPTDPTDPMDPTVLDEILRDSTGER